MAFLWFGVIGARGRDKAINARFPHGFGEPSRARLSHAAPRLTPLGAQVMPETMGRAEILALMERETRVAHGCAPHGLGGAFPAETSWLLEGDEFLLRARGEHYFHYRRGAGITVERGADADPSAEGLWLSGSVHSAVACLNGLIPVHASAVEHGGAVHAFAGASGAGKSTLVAALGRYGLPMFADDTLVLDPGEDFGGEGPVACLPGHKRLKLTAQALELTGAVREESVGEDIGKFYATPLAGTSAGIAPLARLVLLEEGPELAIERLSGAERVYRLFDDHYTVAILAAAKGRDPATLFATLSRLARRIEMLRFVRPRDPARFDEGVRFIADWITQATVGARQWG
jgi:hypothetical protein